MFDFDEQRDDPRVKVIQLEKNKLYMRRTDPYGFIELNYDKGQLPDELANAKFTTWEEAQKAVEKYFRERNISQKPSEKKVA